MSPTFPSLRSGWMLKLTLPTPAWLPARAGLTRFLSLLPRLPILTTAFTRSSEREPARSVRRAVSVADVVAATAEVASVVMGVAVDAVTIAALVHLPADLAVQRSKVPRCTIYSYV